MKQTNTKRTKKKLSEMSLEELWQLFPVFLTPHQECWKEHDRDGYTKDFIHR